MEDKIKFEIGDYVRHKYIFDNRISLGRIKEIKNNSHALVVFNCNNSWSEFQNYTAQLVYLSDLKLGWSNWYPFYKKRINSTYQKYFEKRYYPFLNFILSEISNQPELTALYDGACGIGSIYKFLKKKNLNLNLYGFDAEDSMLYLSKMNNNKIETDTAFFKYNLFEKNLNLNPSSRLIITHGVLEHYSDSKILEIIKNIPNSIHYVPLGGEKGYKTPSFGDERLLTKEHWINLCKPEYSFTFNKGKNLCFKIKSNED